ncbi:MAG: hypothetical protein [Bacteriophage sp.]|nr:MAG: hypothetical protein [Bacteriophage sp.]
MTTLATDGIIGQAAYELCGAMFYDEAMKNNRITYLTVYRGEQLQQQAAAGFAAYHLYMEQAMAGMRNYLVNADGNCKCIDCSGITIKTNV